MTQYRKKPVVIDAVQWNGKMQDVIDCHGVQFPTYGQPFNGALRISTLEGDHACELGDWIIKGVKGEFYPCKPDIFAMTYEPATAILAQEPQEPYHLSKDEQSILKQAQLNSVKVQEPQEAVAWRHKKYLAELYVSLDDFQHDFDDIALAEPLFTSPPSQDARVRELELINSNAELRKQQAEITRLTELVRQGEWISVNDRLPEYLEGKDYSENVLCIFIGYQKKQCVSIFNRVIVELAEDGHQWAWARLSACYGDLREAECEWDDDYEVTHWQPLPKSI